MNFKKQSAKSEISHLRCEYMEYPKGVNMASPRFSWTLHRPERGAFQSAYRILVADKLAELNNDSGNFWDSGKIQSNRTVNIAYNGKPLQSSRLYFWKVQVWYQSGECSGWSDVNTFHTGIIYDKDWKAHWIEAEDAADNAPLLRKGFSLNDRVEKATVHVAGLGYHEFYLNGKKVGDHVLEPAITTFNKRVLYSTYDITDQLTFGSNVAGIMLGNGAFRMEKSKERFSPRKPNDFGAPTALVQLEITLANGGHKTITTDETWLSASGPVTFNHFYGGEDYDARKEKPGWSISDYDASAWQGVRIVKGPEGKLDAQSMPPVRVTETIIPGKKSNPKPGLYLFDLEQNIPGWWRLTVEGECGVKVRIRGAETLNDALFPKPLAPNDRLSTKHDYHANVWTTYTLKGQGPEVYEPRFFYTGYRYVEAKIDCPEKVKSINLEGRVVHSDLPVTGSFSSSSRLLNDIYKATVWSQRGNLHGYPTDCPQREKGAYTGDGQVIAETSMHDFQMAAFYRKWLNDMKDSQWDNGRIPNTAPELVGGHGGGIAWGSAYILILWWMYQYYDDVRILRQHYCSIKKYIHYLYNLARSDANPEENLVINDFGGYWDSLGEWCAPGQWDGPIHSVVNTAYYFKNVQLFSRIAGVLGEKKDAKRYSELSENIAYAFNEKFFNPETNLYGTDEPYQTYQLLALSFGLVPADRHAEVLQTVCEDIRKNRNGHFNTGILGTKQLWSELVNSGHGDLAYSAVTQKTYPSYGYWLKNGATTLWERWSGENSHNHQMFGSVNEFFYKYLAGIRPPTEEGTDRGYKYIRIKPFIPEGLLSVKAYLQTMNGRLSSAWENQDGFFKLTVTIPTNTTGEICIPLFKNKVLQITEGGQNIWKNEEFYNQAAGVKRAKKEKRSISFWVQSGTYQFAVTKKEKVEIKKELAHRLADRPEGSSD